jgi:hypothetical protein
MYEGTHKEESESAPQPVTNDVLIRYLFFSLLLFSFLLFLVLVFVASNRITRPLLGLT